MKNKKILNENLSLNKQQKKFYFQKMREIFIFEAWPSVKFIELMGIDEKQKYTNETGI